MIYTSLNIRALCIQVRMNNKRKHIINYTCRYIVNISFTLIILNIHFSTLPPKLVTRFIHSHLGNNRMKSRITQSFGQHQQVARWWTSMVYILNHYPIFLDEISVNLNVFAPVML